jgi:hypothetical protein
MKAVLDMAFTSPEEPSTIGGMELFPQMALRCPQLARKASSGGPARRLPRWMSSPEPLILQG